MNQKKLSVLRLAFLGRVQYRLLAIETLLLMALFLVLGGLSLDYTTEELWKASYQHVPLLVTSLVIFGAYRAIEATNAAKLFTSYALSYLVAGVIFLLSVRFLIESGVDNRFDLFFLFVAFFVLNSVRPLLLICKEH